MRAVGIIRKMYGLLLLYFMVIFIFTTVIFLSVFDIGQDNFDSMEYYTFNYSSWFRILNTLLIGISTNNTPDLALGDPSHRGIYILFYVCTTMFNLFMANGLIIAIINQKYREIFQEEMDSDDRLTEQQRLLIE